MRLFTNHEAADLSDPATTRLVYNALDNCITRGVADELMPKVAAQAEAARVYRAERTIQAAAMAVQWRGIKVDMEARKFAQGVLSRAMRRAERVLCRAVGYEVNPRSPDQLKKLFYEQFGLQVRRDKKTGKPTTGIDALEKIRDGKAKFQSNDKKREWRVTAMFVARCILAIRDWKKQSDVLRSKVRKGRLRCTFSVGSTDTFRFSSTKSHMGDGTNLQNITARRRYIAVPDNGFVLVGMDQEQAESRIVAYASGDPAYIEAHESEDTHTYVCRLVWPDEDWCGEIGPDRELAEEPNFLRHFSRRDLAKRVQHGLNYGATEHSLARTLQITIKEAKALAVRYFNTFPGIRAWQREIIRQVKEHGVLHYPGGYMRQFFDRTWDAATHRAAIASYPQSICAWINHIAFTRIWREFDGDYRAGHEGPDVQVLLHGHDAVDFQVRAEWADELIPQIVERAKVAWPMPGGTMIMPWDVKRGDNWKEVS